MTRSVGRCSTLGTFNRLQHSTRELRIEGTLDHADPNVNLASAHQVAGLYNPDELVVPVVFDEHPHLSGGYRVLQSTIDWPPGGGLTGQLPYTIVLEPVADHSAPTFESQLLGGFRTNLIGVITTDARAIHAVPANVLDYVCSGTQQTPAVTITTATGEIRAVRMTDVSGIREQLARYSMRPADWYAGAALVEQEWAPGQWLAVQGRHLAQLAGNADGWRISNGRLRATIEPNSGITLEAWSAGSWVASQLVRFQTMGGVTEFLNPHGAAVVMNTPQQVLLRTMWRRSTWTPPHVIDLRLSRGSHLLDIVWKTAANNSQGRPGTVVWASVPGGSWIDDGEAGAQWSSGTSGGARLLRTATGVGHDGAAATAWAFGIGMGTDASGPFSPSSQTRAYFAPLYERVRAVRR